MKNTVQTPPTQAEAAAERFALRVTARLSSGTDALPYDCLLYTSDAADE